VHTPNGPLAEPSVERRTVPVNDLSRADRGLISGAVAEVVNSSRFVLGEQVTAFEHELAEYVGVSDAVGVASGTDALEFAFRAVCPEGRKTVVTAANAGGYSLTAARRAGFGVRFADVDASSHLLTAATVAPTLDESVGVVVVTHLYGRAADVPGIRALCEPLGIAVVEDCAQAIGAALPQGRVGSMGDVAAFSFYPTKNLGAIGDGGAVTTTSDAVADRVRLLRQYGWKGKYRIGLDGGRNSRLDEIQAGVLRARLPFVDDWNRRRRDILGRYFAAASPDIHVLPAIGDSHVGHLGVVVCEDRNSLVEYLSRRGIQTDVHYPVPDHKQPAFSSEYSSVQLPVTERLAEQVLSVPLFPELREDEIERICAALAEFRL